MTFSSPLVDLLRRQFSASLLECGFTQIDEELYRRPITPDTDGLLRLIAQPTLRIRHCCSLKLRLGLQFGAVRRLQDVLLDLRDDDTVPPQMHIYASLSSLDKRIRAEGVQFCDDGDLRQPLDLLLSSIREFAVPAMTAMATFEAGRDVLDGRGPFGWAGTRRFLRPVFDLQLQQPERATHFVDEELARIKLEEPPDSPLLAGYSRFARRVAAAASGARD